MAALRFSSLATVFVASFCSLVLELVAGRMLAPKFGVSLYTWTTIIGIVLLGLSLGGYLGGRIADRRADRVVLSAVFLLGSVATVVTLVVVHAALVDDRWLPLLPLVPRIVAVNLVAFLPPSLFLGAVTPIIAKRDLLDLTRGGRTIGSLYAAGTLGSIAGTFATGFVLVELIGTRLLVVLVAAALFAMSAWIGRFWQTRPVAVGAIALLLSVSGSLVLSRESLLEAPCERETSYFCIHVYDVEIDGEPARALMLDHMVHGRNAILRPRQLYYSYLRTYADVTAVKAAEKPDLRALFIGGGAYTFPRYLESVYPESQIQVIEIDPAVTEASYAWLGLSRDSRIVSHNQDARAVLTGWSQPGSFDIIYGDAFNDIAIPYHLTTVEFDRLVYQHLADDGVYLANVIDDERNGELLRAYINTMRQVFPNVYLLRWGNFNARRLETLVVAGSKRPLPVDAFGDPDAVRKYGRPLSSFVVSPNELWGDQSAGRDLILTDDYAPVDQLAARLFLWRGQ